MSRLGACSVGRHRLRAMLVGLLGLIVIGFGVSLSRPQIEMAKFPYERHLSKRERKWIDAQLKRMRLEEKIGQMIMIPASATFLNLESERFKTLRHHILEHRVGGILLGRGPVYEAAMMINRLQELARFPLLVAAEVDAGVGTTLHGATLLPWNMAVGATGDTAWAMRQGSVTAQEARLLGVTLLIGPIADVIADPRHRQIGVRAYGDDPRQVARMVSAYIRGAQMYGVVTAVKTFPGYGSARPPVGEAFPLLTGSIDELREQALLPFRAAIESGTGALLVGHIAVPQIDSTPLPSGSREEPLQAEARLTRPASLSPVVIADLLRRQMGFNGLILTDRLSDATMTAHLTPRQCARSAVKAGVDILLAPADVDGVMRSVWEAVRRGEIAEARIDESVRRILTAKVRLGLAANRFTDTDLIDSFVGGSASRRVAQTIAQRAITLVRDERHTIPLSSPSLTSVMHLIVTDAEFNAEERRTLGRVLTDELRRRRLDTERIVIDRCTPIDRAAAILRRAESVDLVLVSLFAHPRRDHQPGLPAAARALLKRIAERQPSVVVISFGRPYLLLEYPALPTFVSAFGDAGDAVYAQRAVARALFGQAPIGGRLPIALPGLYPRGHGITLSVSGSEPAPKRP